MVKNIVYSSFLILVILSASVYFLMPGEIRIDIKKTLTTYAVFEDGKYQLAATEYVYLYDGSTKMRANSREITYWNDSNNAYAVRTSNWKDDITTIQTYKFGKSESDVENLPLENKFECINCQGKFVQFEIRDILYDGETKNIESGFSFGHNMKIDFEDNSDFSWAKVYQQTIGDKIIVKFKADEPIEEYSVRLYDPEPIINQDWIIDGDRVYIDDEFAYISAKPAKMRHSGYVYFNATSKVYTGDVDFILGNKQPKSIELYKPTWFNNTESYTCNDYFNYTLNPKHAWCYKNISTYDNATNQTNGSYLQLIYDRDFEWGNLETKTIYWNESYVENWVDYSSSLTFSDYSYQGVNEWWYLKNVPMVQNEERYFRVWIDVQPGETGKYWAAFKRSSETIQQAITNSHLYALDPWTSGDCMATGGSIAIDGDYCVHTFTTDSSFNTTTTINNMSLLIVAGGGGGGTQHAGGGGAGGLIYKDNNYSITSGDYSVSIGSGGTGSPAGASNTRPPGDNGYNSTFDTLKAIGGGGGGSYRNAVPYLDGQIGGSGGGGGALEDTGISLGGNGTAGQGFAGGIGSTESQPYIAGGGGGAGEVGFDYVGAVAGAGGDGKNYSINGSNSWFAGGGGGGTYRGTKGLGGNGGGGDGGAAEGATAATNGIINTGGGGGGGAAFGVNGANGGSGIVIIRYSILGAYNLTGTLKDNLGGGTLGMIYATKQETNETYFTTSNASGYWIINGLSAGNYSVSGYDTTNSTPPGAIKPWVVVG